MFRRKLEKIMAAAIYDELDPKTKVKFERLLSKSPTLREEYESLTTFVEKIPREQTFQPTVDILPLVYEKLSQKHSSFASFSIFSKVSIAASVMVGLFIVGILGLLYTDSFLPKESEIRVTEPTNSALQELLREGLILKAQGDFQNALTLFRSVVDSQPDASLAGEAQLEIANLYFEKLKWFQDAYEAYRLLRHRYPAVFASKPQNGFRLDLLEESARDNFASLYLLEQARNYRGNDLAPWEEILARYPGERVAELAIDEMIKRYLPQLATSQGGVNRLQALEQLRQHCTNPIALARLGLELGEECYRSLHDSQRARQLAQEALETQNPQLMVLAKDFLGNLSVSPAP